MKNKKKNIIICIILIAVGAILGYLLYNVNNNLVKLNYNEIKEKIDNKESFVLCISRTTCSHCNQYKPKLSEVANKYKIKIYYTDVDKYSEEELKEFTKIISFDGSTPITLFIKNGEEKTTATRIEGNVPTNTIVDKLKKNGFIK